MDFFLGTILMWPMDWAPQNWALCYGQQLPISSNTALFSLLGTAYGGNGTTTFALPDLRGRMPIGMGQGPGLTPRQLGDKPGAEDAVLNSNNLPAHTHTMTASNTDYTKLTQSPGAGWTLGAASSVTIDRNPIITAVNMYGGANPASPVPSAPSSVAGSTNPEPVQTIPPALCVNFIICTQGLFPSRQ